jgi:hypothetical protein
MCNHNLGSQEDRRSRSGHDPKLRVQERLRCWHCSARRTSCCRPGCNDHAHDAELIANLLLLERSHATRQRSVPVWLRVDCRGSCVIRDSRRNRVVRGGLREGSDFGCDG